MSFESPVLDLDAIHETVANAPSEPDDKTKQEISDLEAQSMRADLEGKLQDINQRKEYANKIFWLISVWLGCMILIVLLSGVGHKYLHNFFVLLIQRVTNWLCSLSCWRGLGRGE